MVGYGFASILLNVAVSIVSPAHTAEPGGSGCELSLNADSRIAECTQVIENGTNSGAAYYARGTAYLAKREYDLAIADFNEAIRVDPTYVDAYICRGQVYLYKREYGRAIADYDEAIRLNSPRPV